VYLKRKEQISVHEHAPKSTAHL